MGRERLTWYQRMMWRLFGPTLLRSMPTFESRRGGRGGAGPDDDSIMAEAYRIIPAAYAGIFAIAHSVAQVPLRVYRVRPSGTEEPLPGHELAQMLSFQTGVVNPFFPVYDLHEETQSFLELTGRAYWLLAGGRAEKGGVPAQIYSLRADAVSPIYPEDGASNVPVVGWEYRINGKTIRYNVNEIVAFNYFNPFSFIIGQSSLRAAQESILTEHYAGSYNKLFFKNGATPSGVLSYNESLDPDELRRKVEEFVEAFSGSRNAFKVMGIDGGAKYETKSPTQKDMMFLDTMKWNREQVLMCLGVPPCMVALLDDTKYANAPVQERQFWALTIKPKLIKRDARITQSLARRWGADIVVRSDLSSIEALQTGLTEIAAQAKEFFNMGALTPNEVRTWISTRKLPELKPLPTGDVPYLPIGTAPAGESPSSPTPAPAPVDQVKALIDDLNEQVREEEREAKKKTTAMRNRIRTKRVAAAAPDVQSTTGEIFDAQEQALIEKASAIARSEPLERALTLLAFVQRASERADALQELNRSLAEIDAVLAAMRSENVDKVEAVIRSLVAKFGDLALSDIGVSTAFNAVNEPVLRYLGTHAAQLMTWLDNSTVSMVKDEIQKAFLSAQTEGLNIVDTAGEIVKAGIRSGFELSRQRANTIAQTETTRAYNFTDMEAWRQSGVVKTRVWRGITDGKQRASHAAMEGVEVPLDQPFMVGDVPMDHPGDPSAPASETVECRCGMEVGQMAVGREFSLTAYMHRLAEVCAEMEGGRSADDVLREVGAMEGVPL